MGHLEWLRRSLLQPWSCDSSLLQMVGDSSFGIQALLVMGAFEECSDMQPDLSDKAGVSEILQVEVLAILHVLCTYLSIV